ncbi:hypothetical protein Ari01nite_09560 [Paractinoplanes rishiriensis]|uniref:F5/8 type C domain-containing protein n=2 Tax=Paractinoplanes rishiriensis TaxID=1050105 RepID=A0A919JYV9_9ACTN|nr:hypothetical protein Ari01nite_09560 [Actinoplanes rishiriensis]
MLCVLVGVAAVVHQQPDAPPGPAADPHAGHIVPSLVPAAVTTAAPLPRTGWEITADDAAETATRVLDGDPATSWRTAATALPHHLTIDTRNRVALSGLTYLPAAGETGRIGQYQVQISDNGTTWSAPVATGTFADDEVLKTVAIGTVVTRYVRFSALTEAGNRTSAVAAAEINLLGGTDPALPRTGWTIAPDSQETAAQNGRAVNALDGNTTTFWHSRYSPAPAGPLPHAITVDMKTANLVSGLAYLPRQDTSKNGQIGRYRIETSMNGTVWAPPSTGAFTDSKSAQIARFAPTLARFVKLTALSEAGNRGPWSSVAEVNLLGRANPTLSRSGWTVTASSQETAAADNRAALVLDDNATTFWHSRYSPAPAVPLPHTLQFDLTRVVNLGGLSYLPRPTGVNGRIGQYRIATSTDNSTWDVQANGTFGDSAAQQTVVFPPVDARYVRLIAVTEAGNRGPWSTAAEIYLLGPSGSIVPQRGAWGAPVGFPLVPVAAALLPNGKVLTWSAFQKDAFSGGTGKTVTAIWDPATGVSTQRTVSNTGHDMFCPGISALPDGRVVVTGGNNSEKTSIYNPATDAWTGGPNMTTPRGYQSSVTLGDGRVFTIGGSWSGPIGGTNGVPHKAGEVWSASGGWKALPGADATPSLTADANPLGDYRKDNHTWLFAWSGGKVLQAGPSRRMNWYSADGTGSVTTAGTRGGTDAMNGTAVMYDTGKILAVGGATSYEGVEATADAHLITVRGSTVTSRQVSSMANTRSFHSSVVLPDGRVAVIGGQNFPVPFSDNTAVLNAELWDPVTESFSTMATARVPRTYHSVALLLPDGRVFSGGGGLCGAGCSTNHFDGEIWTPPYLLTATGAAAPRPVLTEAPTEAANGDTVTVRTDREVTGFAMVRMGTVTHTVNTDQRRLSLPHTTTADGGYELTIPPDTGIAVPGYWMLFALDAKGVPSVAKIFKIG